MLIMRNLIGILPTVSWLFMAEEDALLNVIFVIITVGRVIGQYQI